MSGPSASGQIHRIRFDIPWPPNTAYAYLIEGPEPILIDAGPPGEEGWQSLVDGLAAAGFEPADVAHLFVTHPHTDHDGQVADLLDTADPVCYAPVGVRARLQRDPAELASVVKANAVEVGLPDPEEAVDRSVDSLRRNRSCLPPDEIDVELSDGEPITAGGITFEPVTVPGHQIDQAAYVAIDGPITGAFFAGDTLIEPFRPAALHVGLDRGCHDCIDAFYDGLTRLEAVDVDRVYPGHGPVFADASAAIERDRAALDSLVERCRETLVELGSATAYEVTDARIDDPRRMSFSVFETIGSLAQLERRGELDSTRHNGVRRYEA